MSIPRPHASELCFRCGICCDGTLFSYIKLDSEDHALAQRARLPLVKDGERVLLKQPCSVLSEDGRCSIYSDRPSACARYTCIVRKRYVEGALSFEESLAKIERTRDLAASIRARTIEQPMSFQDVSRLLAATDDNTLAWRRENAELLLDLITFAQICRRDFGTATASSVG
jgi:hypothetical protein